jgi:exodeoxyribonuclease VII large subunit
MPVNVISVSTLNRYVKSLLEGDSNLASVYVRGQISNFSSKGGHYYFSLKDENAQVHAVMFRSANMKLIFMPENDMCVIARCHVSMYEVRGDYQIYVDDMQPDGTGALAIAFEQLKTKLEKEGLFDPEHKKDIPEFPQKIGVVTSREGAAFRDIINIITRRFPVADIIICPVTVQGSTAAGQIADAVDLFNETGEADVLIVGRGGGSIEDLWPFNEEIVARAVYRSRIPVISAVGHETDFTICDFTADLRAPTPSAAAELAVPDSGELNIYLSGIKRQLFNSATNIVNNCKNRIGTDAASLKSNSPEKKIEELLYRIGILSDTLNKSVSGYLSAKKNSLVLAAAGLDASSPVKILSKGYSVVLKDNKIVSKAGNLSSGDIVKLRFSDGEKECEVLK